LKNLDEVLKKKPTEPDVEEKKEDHKRMEVEATKKGELKTVDFIVMVGFHHKVGS
jgi:hypothetical protein